MRTNKAAVALFQFPKNGDEATTNIWFAENMIAADYDNDNDNGYLVASQVTNW